MVKTINIFIILLICGFLCNNALAASASYSSGTISVTGSSSDPRLNFTWLATQGLPTSAFSKVGATCWLNASLSLANSNTKFDIGDPACTKLIMNNAGSTCQGDVRITNIEIQGGNVATPTTGAFHDVYIHNSGPLSFTGTNYDVYNVKSKSCSSGLDFTKVNNINITNITVCDTTSSTDAVGIRLYDCHGVTAGYITLHNIGNYLSPSTGQFGIVNDGSSATYCKDIYIHDVYCDGTGWSSIETGNSYVTNITYRNCVVHNPGHNAYDIHGGQASHLDNCISYDSNGNYSGSEMKNAFLICFGGGYNTLRNCAAYDTDSTNAYGVALDISEDASNTYVENFTATNSACVVNTFGSTYGGTTYNLNNVTLVNVTGDASNNHGVQWGIVDNVQTTENHLIDSDISSQVDGLGLTVEVAGPGNAVINSKVTGPYIPSGGDVDYYYYPNIKIVDASGVPVSGALVTTDTTARNGIGQIQKSFYTDSNGRLNTAGNRTNWLAVLESRHSTSTNYKTQISVSKGGQTNSTLVDPSASWYSPDPAKLQGPQVSIVLNTSTPDPNPTPTPTPGPVMPVANFSSNVTSGNSPLSVQFSDASQNATEWSWDFGDNNVSVIENPIKVYSIPGTYSVSLKASNCNGSDTKTRSITVNAPQPIPQNLTASFTASPTSGRYPLTVTFVDTSVGNETSRKWSFGDGYTSTAKTISHTYRITGTYTAKLTATNSAGSSTATKTITVTRR